MLHSLSRRRSLLLSSLEISGFKSFARTVRVEFPSGITAFVGANGSGKSNIVDAVRWCLGEQSVRDLRAQRSEDVIYAGPRRAVGVAEVALTFEDREGGELRAWSELCIARRLYRSGESEYLVNRTRARLRDVIGSLHELGIDSGRHVVVTQGMADSWLSASLLERRALLEQTAGLSSYRERRDEARQKLSATSQNIETIEAVLAELEPRVRLLRRQARAVQERDAAGQRLRGALIAWYAARWRALVVRLEALQDESETLAAERRMLLEEVDRLESQAESALERERAWHQQLESRTATFHAVDRERDSTRREVDQLARRLDAAQRALHNVHLEGSALRSAGDEAQERLRVALRSRHVLEAERADEEGALEELEASLQPIQQTLNLRLEELDAAHAAYNRDEQVASGLYRQKMALSGRLDAAEARASETARWLTETDARLAPASRRLQEIEEELPDVLGAEKELAREAEEIERQVDAVRARVSRLDLLSGKLRAWLADRERSLTRKRRALEALDRELGPGLLQSLAVSEGWERAIAAALGPWGQASPDGASPLMLRSLDLSPFLAWREQLSQQLPGALWGDRVVDGWPHGATSPLAGTVLVDGDEAAESAWQRIGPVAAYTMDSPPLQIVTKEGKVWSALGVKLAERDDRAGSYLESKRELAVLSERIAERRRWRDAVEAVHARSASELAELRRRSQTAQTRLAMQRKERKAREEMRDRLRGERRQLLAERHEREAALQEQQARVAAVTSELAAIDQNLERATESRTAALARRDAAQSAADQARSQSAGIVERIETSRRRIELLRAKEGAQVELLQAIRRDVARASEQTEALAGREKALTADIDALTSALEIERPRLEDVLAAVREEQEKLEAVRRQRPSGSGQGHALRDMRGRLADVMSRHERALAQLGHTEAERERLLGEIRDELGIEPGAFPEQSGEAPSESEIRRLRARAGQYADVEPSVIEEARHLEERQQHLQLHVEDLKAAAHDLNQIMTVADREMRRRFQDALGAVSQEFSRVFRMMLQGGDASLEQVDDEGGIEIRAQLPGRRARSSAAFSGGERALIASSLLFGVLKIRPTPFCILDEVDAALDETNVDRYLAVLRDVSRSTQMIVVTHNRATMAAADVLYGLTMDDEGVSSLLSLRLDAYDAAV